MTVPESVRRKLSRAKEHLEAFRHAEGAFFVGGAYSLRRSIEAGGTDFVYASFGLLPPPVRFSLLIGDVLNNARSALDHIAFVLADSPSLTDVQRRQIAFPICDSPSDFARRAKTALPNVPAARLAVAEACQPVTGRTADWLYLRSLRDLNNVDKHRRLNLIATAAEMTAVALPPGVGQPEVRFAASHGQLGEGNEVVRLVFTSPPPPSAVDFDLRCSLAFDESGPHQYQSVTTVLDILLSVIEWEIIPSFDTIL